MPPWHVGHVVKKLMLAHQPSKLLRGQLAKATGLQPGTISHLLDTGRSEDDTVQRIAEVFGFNAFDLRQEVERSNQRGVTEGGDFRRRSTDRNQDEQDADAYARRLVQLSLSAQTAIFTTIRAFEAALRRRDD